MSASRMSIGSSKFVYFLIADKKFPYETGKSRIAYIGTTTRGVDRLSESVATRAHDILSIHGVRSFHVRVVTCPPRQHVKTWLKLERAFLIRFKEMFGEVPRCNSHGKNMVEADEFNYFARNGITGVLEELS